MLLPLVPWRRRPIFRPRSNRVRPTLGATLAAMAILVAMAGCGPSRDQRSLRPIPIFSPNGELLSRGGKGLPGCPEVVGDWWDRLAAQHGGVVGKAAFLADAEAQFTAMDLDHDGFITPSELSDYRAGADEQMGEERLLPPGVTLPQNAGSGGYGRRLPSDSNLPQRRLQTVIPADVVDPVMSADKSLSFKVSREDFMAQANDLFAEMDKGREGKISREAAIALRCPIAR